MKTVIVADGIDWFFQIRGARDPEDWDFGMLLEKAARFPNLEAAQAAVKKWRTTKNDYGQKEIHFMSLEEAQVAEVERDRRHAIQGIKKAVRKALQVLGPEETRTLVDTQFIKDVMDS